VGAGPFQSSLGPAWTGAVVDADPNTSRRGPSTPP